MSKIKTNPSAIKNYIVAVKHSELSDSKKEGIIQVLQQYTKDKQEGIYPDGLIKQLIYDVIMELLYEQEGLTRKEMAEKLFRIVKNMDRRNYINLADEEKTENE